MTTLNKITNEYRLALVLVVFIKKLSIYFAAVHVAQNATDFDGKRSYQPEGDSNR